MSQGKQRPEKYDIMVSQKMREIRLKKALSQDEVSSLIGVSIQQIQKYESAKNRISAGKLYTLAKNLKIDVSQFYEFEDKSYIEINKVPNNYRMLKMLKAFESLSDLQQKALIQFVRIMFQQNDNNANGRIE